MSSEIFDAAMRQHNQRRVDRASGMPRTGMHLGSFRTADAQVINIHRLPCAISNQQMQDANGNFLYLPGYSDPNGTDIGAPGGGS